MTPSMSCPLFSPLCIYTNSSMTYQTECWKWERCVGCDVTYFLIISWHNWVWVYWCFTSHATIFQLYMWRHRCAGGLKKLYLRSGSQRHRHFVGFFNVPVVHRHGTTLFIWWFWHTAPFSRLLPHAGDTEEVFLTKPPNVEEITILSNHSKTNWIYHHIVQRRRKSHQNDQVLQSMTKLVVSWMWQILDTMGPLLPPSIQWLFFSFLSKYVQK